MVPGVLSLLTSPREFAVGTCLNQRLWRRVCALSKPHAGDGSRAGTPSFHGQGVAASSPASSDLTRSEAGKATGRGCYDPVSHPQSQESAIAERCIGPRDPCEAKKNSQLRPMGGPSICLASLAEMSKRGYSDGQVALRDGAETEDETRVGSLSLIYVYANLSH